MQKLTTHCEYFFTDVLGGDVGVAVTSCIFLTGALQYGMRQSAETENLMTSVERVMEYGQIKSEADLTKTKSPSEKNPDNDKHFSEGVVEFDNVSLKYDEDCKLILKNINFKTEANDKIGIVGRTGAGKSSLIVALFRHSIYIRTVRPYLFCLNVSTTPITAMRCQ